MTKLNRQNAIEKCQVYTCIFTDSQHNEATDERISHVRITVLSCWTISMAFIMSGAKLVGRCSFTVGVTRLYVSRTDLNPFPFS